MGFGPPETVARPPHSAPLTVEAHVPLLDLCTFLRFVPGGAVFGIRSLRLRVTLVVPRLCLCHQFLQHLQSLPTLGALRSGSLCLTAATAGDSEVRALSLVVPRVGREMGGEGPRKSDRRVEVSRFGGSRHTSSQAGEGGAG